jgi:hypothetical protein
MIESRKIEQLVSQAQTTGMVQQHATLDAAKATMITGCDTARPESPEP